METLPQPDLLARGILGHKMLIVNVLVAAKMLIAAVWKSLQIPTKNDWLTKLRHIMLMNKLSTISAYRQGVEPALVKFKKQRPPPPLL